MNEINPSDYPKTDISLSTQKPMYRTLPGIILIETIIWSFIGCGLIYVEEAELLAADSLLTKLVVASFPVTLFITLLLWMYLEP